MGTKLMGDITYKTDLEKAYHHLNWDFLKTCLLEFDFPSITVGLIMHCVTSAQLSLIWNSKRLPAFSPTRGLSQGDPLSPYLFVICMEKLSHAILAAVNDGNWKPMYLSQNGPALSHLFFADDVINCRDFCEILMNCRRRTTQTITVKLELQTTSKSFSQAFQFRI